jgi:hypothetical protein
VYKEAPGFLPAPRVMTRAQVGELETHVESAWIQRFTLEYDKLLSSFASNFNSRPYTEVEHFQRSGFPVRRPNSMNNYGLIINEIGLEVGPDRSCLPRHPPRCRPSFLEFNGIK